MAPDAEQASPPTGQLSPAFLGAVLGVIPTSNGDVFSALIGDRFEKLAAGALGDVVRRPTNITSLPSAPPALDVVVTCTFTVPDSNEAFALSLDEHAVRAVVEPLLADHLSVRPAGALADAERGVFDYAVGAWADGLCGMLTDSAGAPVLDRIEHVSVPKPLDAPAAGRVYRHLTVGPNRGLLAVQVSPSFKTRRFSSLIGAAERTGHDDAWLSAVCVLRVSLPPARLDDVDLQSAQVGDVLLLGRTSLEHLAAEATLCSDSGWTIGRVQIRHDSPGVLSVELLNVDPWPQSRDTGSSVLYVLIGRLELTGAQIRSLQRGTVLDLARTEPVLLRAGSRVVAHGELVTACGEVGVRITHRPAEARPE